MDIAIKIDNLTIDYSGKTAVDNLTVSFEKDKFIAIVGPNGSGKSSLLKAITGLIRCSAGSIIVDGISNGKDRSNIIGYVPQIKTLDRNFPAKALELVASGYKKNWPGRLSNSLKSIAHEALEIIGAGNLAEKQLSEMSGGELQKIYLARALVKKPKILLLDEPATGIDMVCERSLNHTIEEYKAENSATVIMVTHDWSSAYYHANNVLLLNKKKVYYGAAKEAFDNANLQLAFSHPGHKHNVEFGLRENA
jgi:zinc transport system ATP-binding protein